MPAAVLMRRHPASLSRNLQSHVSPPSLLHSLHELHNSVLSLAANEHYIFSGSQNQDISVWCKKTFTLKNTLRGHTGSVLALEYAKDKGWLFSSSGDSTVRIWSTITLTLIYVLDPYLDAGAGDLFSLVWCSSLQTIYIGCQNTSLQWYDFNQSVPQPPSRPSVTAGGSAPNSGTSTPTPRKAHKFFDSYPQYERRPADIYAKNGTTTTSTTIPGEGQAVDEDGGVTHTAIQAPRAFLQVPATNVIDSAHYGYIYCIALLEGTDADGLPDGVQLVTGSGDETIKLWNCTTAGPSIAHIFSGSQGAVLSLVACGETIYAGCQDGHVKVLDLETKTLVRTIIVQENVDILSLSMMNSDLYTCSSNGQVQRWSASFDCTASWLAHDGIVLSSIITHHNGREDTGFRLITGGNDAHIKVWEVVVPEERTDTTKFHDDVKEASGDVIPAVETVDTMVYALSKFISIPSVSSIPFHREDCRQAAIWLKKCLSQLGAQSTLLPTGEGTNPLVLGTFNGTKGDHTKPRVLFYGHYDVISAPLEGWTSDPFTLTGRNGYLYARGVTDNKGPIMAVACAAAELLRRRALGLDLVFLIEGEEECGSAGFGQAVRKHKDLIGHIDAILVSNSTWIAEDPPCITHGLRGVVHCAVEISSGFPDLHSGIEGGGVVEPMLDMVKLLSTLTDCHHKVQIPNFYDCVRPQTEEEKQLYRRLAAVTQRPASSLSSRWREPSLTVHSIEISGPKNATVIPGTVKSQVSLRIVPDQDLEVIVKSLCNHLKSSFKTLQSPNRLEVNVEHTADWWLGNLNDPWFKALESAVQEEWDVEPLRIREGGSIPSVPYLEKELCCHALHLPMGQSSDQAHLPNERISLTNLHRGKAVIERFFLTIVEKGILSL